MGNVKNNIQILILDLLTSSKDSSKILKSLIYDLKKVFNIKIVIIGDYRTAIDADHVIIPQIFLNRYSEKIQKMDNVTLIKSFPITKLNLRSEAQRIKKKWY